jgi:hypothetical protein
MTTQIPVTHTLLYSVTLFISVLVTASNDEVFAFLWALELSPCLSHSRSDLII